MESPVLERARDAGRTAGGGAESRLRLRRLLLPVALAVSLAGTCVDARAERASATLAGATVFAAEHGKASAPMLRSRGLADDPFAQQLGDGPDGRYECPYVIDDPEKALAAYESKSVGGHVVNVEHVDYGRMGNRFTTVIRNLALGYCCKSKLVILPEKDEVLAPGMFREGAQGPRMFDFSSSPGVEGFNSSSCKDMSWHGIDSFTLSPLLKPDGPMTNPELFQCIKQMPRIIGCEAAYYFPEGKDMCPESARASHGRIAAGEGTAGGAGTLAIHIRSGDVFEDSPHAAYGQPPLQFYVHAMKFQPWDRVDIITWASNEDKINPVIPALKRLEEDGAFLGTELNIYTKRTMDEDLRSMLCADGVVAARSSIRLLTMFHSSAHTVIMPYGCQNSPVIKQARPTVKVYGVSLTMVYTPFKKWENTPEQRKEHISFSSLSLERC